MEVEVARTTDAFSGKQNLSLSWKDIYSKYKIALALIMVSVITLFLTVFIILLATEPKNLPILSKSQTSVSLNSMAGKSSTAGTGKSSVPGTGKSSTESSLLTPEQEKQVDEILTIVRSNETKFDSAELNEALTGKNELLEVVITKCTENTQKNEKVSGEVILKLMMCANNTESSTSFGLHLKSTIFKIKDPFDKPAENFWNVNLDDAASDIPSSESERTKIVDKVSAIVALDTLSTSFVCNNLVDSFAKTNVPPFTGKLWYEYVVKNFKTEGYYLCTLLNTFDEAIDSKDPLLQIDEIFEKIQEKEMFKSSWNNRVADSFLDYLKKANKLQQSHLVSYVGGASSLAQVEEERRFSKICTLITDLGTYQKIADKIKLGYKTCTSIPIFDIEKLSKVNDSGITQRNLFRTLIDFRFDEMLKNSIEKLNSNKHLFLDQITKIEFKSFPLTRDCIFKISVTDVTTARNFLDGISETNRVNFLKDNSNLSDYSEIITLSSLNDEMLKIIDAKGKYDKITKYEMKSKEFKEILELTSKHEMPNLRNVVLSKIENATDDQLKDISADNKKICNMFINVQTNDEQRSKNIEVLMKKNVIPSSFSFPNDISSRCQQTIINNATENNINDILMANAKSDKIFSSLIKSTHLKDVTPLIVSPNFSDTQLNYLDATSKYMSIPDLKSNDFNTLFETGKNKSLSNLMTKLDEVLKTTDISEISEIKDYSVLKYVFSKSDFADQLKKLTADQLIKINGNYFSAIKECPDDFFTDKNVSALIDHFVKKGSLVSCQQVVSKSKKIPYNDCIKILNKFTIDFDLAPDAVGKCSFTDYDQVKNVRDLCDKNYRFIHALNTLFSRTELWKPEWICEELKQDDAAKYYRYSIPLLFHNVNQFTDDQWNALPSLKDSDTFDLFYEFTPKIFQKIAVKNENLLVQILNRLKSLKEPKSFLPLLKDNESNAGIATPLKKLIFKDSSIYRSVLEGNDFDNYKDIFQDALQKIKETSKSPFLNDDTLKLIETKCDDEFYCDMVYCTKDLQYYNIPEDKLLSIIMKAPDEKALEKFLLLFKFSKVLDNIFYNQTFDETNDAKFLELLKNTTSTVNSWTYEHICGKRIEWSTDGDNPFFEYFCPGKNDLITSNSSTYFSLIGKALKKFSVATVSKPLEHIHENDLSFEKISEITNSIFETKNNDLAEIALLSLRKCDCLKDLSKLRKWLEYFLSDVYNIYGNSYFKAKYVSLKPTLVALCEEINKSVLADLVKSSIFEQNRYIEYCQLGSKCDNDIFTQLCPVLPDTNVMQWLQKDMYDMIGTFLKSEHQHLQTILSNVEVALGKTLLPENINDKNHKYYDIYSRKYFIMGANQDDTKIISHLCVMSLGVKYMLQDDVTNEEIFGKLFELKNHTNTLEKLLTGIEKSFKDDCDNLKSYMWAEFAVKYGNDVFKAFCPIEQVKRYDKLFKGQYNYFKIHDADALKFDHMKEVKQALGIK